MDTITPQGGIWAMLASATMTVRFVLLILACMSLTSWSIIFMKIFTLSNARKDAAVDYKRFQEAENLKIAMRALGHNKHSPAYAVGLQAFEELARMEDADLEPVDKARIAMDNIRRTLRQAVGNEVGNLAKSLAFLATCGSAAPFIGLFGTVWGIMNSFHAISLQQSAALSSVAPGISEALIATAIGLAVAIPATLAYNFFLGFIQAIERELVNFAGAFLNRIQREVSWMPQLKEPPARRISRSEDI
ncbi:MAG: MotA/TolQ/ExbB proton channel family protein [Desulfovibrionaceae bacterium]|nr:MotA/TolQ/ExbB proton channel family protein [Desulfovibrionaceae bacterium]MBF0513823.1 MotA/TolQ/ExbB proton channel family protein [Desulfovibrionaceae bacterium]